MIKLGILGSTRGTSLLPIIEAINEKQLAASIEVVLSNKPDALILKRASEHGILSRYIESNDLSRDEYDAIITGILREYQVELIVLIGYMRILSDRFIRDWQNKIINIHPSLLPAFAGKMDLDVHRAVLADGVNETGCTVHMVTEEVDAGPVVVQKKCRVLADDTPETLKARVQALEGEALIEAISQHRQALSE